jgi:hypothetical protein
MKYNIHVYECWVTEGISPLRPLVIIVCITSQLHARRLGIGIAEIQIQTDPDLKQVTVFYF